MKVPVIRAADRQARGHGSRLNQGLNEGQRSPRAQVEGSNWLATGTKMRLRWTYGPQFVKYEAQKRAADRHFAEEG